MNYIGLSEAEGVIGLIVAKQVMHAANPMRPAEALMYPYFEIGWAESLPGMGTLALLTALRKVYTVPEIAVESEILLDVTTTGAVMTRLLRDNGYYHIVPMMVITGLKKSYGEDGTYGVPRRELVSALGVLVESGRMSIAEKVPAAEALNVQVKALRAKPQTDSVDVPRGDETLAISLGLIAWRIDTLGELRPQSPLGSRVVPEKKPYNPATAGLTED